MIRSMVSKMVRSMITTVINPFDGLISRYFVTLDPVLQSHYEMAQPITFSGDFEIEVEFSKGPQTESYEILIGNPSGTSFYIATRNSNNIKAFIDGFSVNGVIPVTDRKLHLIKLIRVGSLVSLYVDGVADGTMTRTGNVVFDQIGRNYYGNYFDGIIANAKFTDKSGASDVVTTFKLDNSPAAENYTYSTELLDNNTFLDNANARQYLVATKGWIITDGGEV